MTRKPHATWSNACWRFSSLICPSHKHVRRARRPLPRRRGTVEALPPFCGVRGASRVWLLSIPSLVKSRDEANGSGRCSRLRRQLRHGLEQDRFGLDPPAERGKDHSLLNAQFVRERRPLADVLVSGLLVSENRQLVPQERLGLDGPSKAHQRACTGTICGGGDQVPLAQRGESPRRGIGGEPLGLRVAAQIDEYISE